MSETTTGKLPKQIEYKPRYGTIEEYLAYCEMVKMVTLVNTDAALLLTQQWEMPESFAYCGDLSGCFVWDDHHKRWADWREIYCALWRVR